MKNKTKCEHCGRMATYMAASGILLCGKEDCFEVSLAKKEKFVKKLAKKDRKLAKILKDLGMME